MMNQPTEKYNAIVVGELNMDLILTGLDKFPELKKEIFAKEMFLNMGSSAAIFAANLSSLGTKVAFLGKIGRDQYGDYILKKLSEKGVDIKKIIISETSKTGITVALSFKNERSMITYPGAMLELTESDIRNEDLRQVQHLHVSSVFMQPALKEGIVKLFRRAKDAGITTSLDTQWDPEEKWDCDWKTLLPAVDVFLPNLDELKNITKKQDAEACINSIKDFLNIIVVKNGGEGCIAWQNNQFYKQEAFLNTEVKDAIGAGDSFNAGFIHKFIHGKKLEECLEFGALCGAINTTAYGGTTAFSNKKDIKQIAIDRFKYVIHDL